MNYGMDYEYKTYAEFSVNGTKIRMELKDEDRKENVNYQIDPDFPGETTCFAVSSYWALLTLEKAGAIENLDFYQVKVFYDDDDDDDEDFEEEI